VSLPSGPALRSWWIYLSLTLASALAAHLAFDAADGGLAALISRPIHLLYGLVVVVAFAGAALDVYAHRPAERRRRIALMQGALGEGRVPLAVSLLMQSALAGASLRFEPSGGSAPQLALAGVCALVALCVGALLLRRIESSILRLVRAAFAGRRPRRSIRRTAGVRLRAVVALERTYCLFRPNRPPPLFA